MLATSSPSSKRAKARWAILRSALLQNASVKNKETTEEQGKEGSEENENDMSDHHHSQFSIHRFPGFQLLNYCIIPPPPTSPTIVVGTSLLGPHPDANNNNVDTHVEGNDFDYIEYEIELPPVLSISNKTTTTTPTTLQVRTRERQRPRRRKNNQEEEGKTKHKFNLHELMSHVHHGVDNTGNTRVWDSSSTLTYLIFSGSFSAANGAASSYSSASSSSSLSSSSMSRVIPGLLVSSSSSSFKDVIRSSVPPPIGLKQIFALSRYHHNIHYDSVVDTTKRRTKLLKVVELGAGMAGLPSLALYRLGKMAHSLLSDTTTTTAPATASLKKNEEEEEEEEKEQIPMIDVTITDGHPTAVQNNEACAALTSTIYEDGNSRNDSTETTTDATTPTNTKAQIQSRKLLWKATYEGAEECQALLNASANNRRGNNKDATTTTTQFDLGLVSDCIHFIEFHAALIATIGRLLRVGGICILCQPCRGKSLQLFLEMVHAVNVNSSGTESDRGALFDLNVYDQYDDKVLQMHNEQLALNSSQGGCYNPDIHYPIILSLKKLREYNEEMDTEAAVDHLSTRK